MLIGCNHLFNFSKIKECSYFFGRRFTEELISWFHIKSFEDITKNFLIKPNFLSKHTHVEDSQGFLTGQLIERHKRYHYLQSTSSSFVLIRQCSEL